MQWLGEPLCFIYKYIFHVFVFYCRQKSAPAIPPPLTEAANRWRRRTTDLSSGAVSMTTSCCWTAEALRSEASSTAANTVQRPRPNCLAALGAMPNYCTTPLEVAVDCAACFAVCPRCLRKYDWTAERARRWYYVSACRVRPSFEQARCGCVHKLRRNARFALSTCKASAIMWIVRFYAAGKGLQI